MSDPRFVWNMNALFEIRSSPAVAAHLEAVAQAVCDAANAEGEGTYVVGSRQGLRRPQGRWRATVVTADYKAMRDNLRHNTLLKALGRV